MYTLERLEIGLEELIIVYSRGKKGFVSVILASWKITLLNRHSCNRKFVHSNHRNITETVADLRKKTQVTNVARGPFFPEK